MSRIPILMKPKAPSDAPLEEGPNPRHFPRINKLARISFFIGIGNVMGSFFALALLILGRDSLWIFIAQWLLIALLATALVGAFCGHCACIQIITRRPHQKGKAMAVFGLIGCYVYSIGVVFLILTVVLVL